MKDISYNELIEIAQEEGIVILKDVSSVFKKIVKEGDDFEEYSYSNSTRKKLRDLAKLVSNPEYKVFADSDVFHNLAIDFSKLNLYDCALSILERGLNEFPSSDLLADKILYASESGQYDLCEDAYERLNCLDKGSWGWRAYSFTIKYHLKKVKGMQKGEIRDRCKSAVYALAEEFIAYSRINPEDSADRAYFDMASLVKELGVIEDGKEAVTRESILRQGCKAIHPAPQCALSLSEMLIERGSYDEAITFLSQCKLDTNSPQPSVNPAYVFLLYAMAKTSKLIEETVDGDYSGKKSEVESIYRDFHTAVDSFEIEETYRNAAKRTINALEIQTGFKDTTSNLDGDEFV